MSFAALVCLLAAWTIAPAGSADLRKWLDEYRRGAIDLHQPVPAAIIVPAARGADGAAETRYCSTVAVDDLRARIDDTVAEDSLASARVLMDLATYQPVVDPVEERRRFVARQPWIVRRLGLEGLRRLTANDVRTWLATIALHDTHPLDGVRTRAAACRALGTTMDERILKALAGALDDDAIPVRVAAAIALGDLQSPLALTALEHAQEDAADSVRIEALFAIDRVTATRPELHERRLAAFARGLRDASWATRSAAARALGAPWDRAAIPLLIDALEAEAPGGAGRPDARRRVRSRIRAALIQLTGKDYPSDRAADWSAWWKDVATTFELDPSTLHVPAPEQGPRFFGIPLDTDVVLFLIDASGSMAQPATGNDGPTRLFLAQFELKRCLASLEVGTRFNIVAFNEDVMAFQPAAVAKSDATLWDALAFVAKMEAKGGTDLHRALDFALGIVADPVASGAAAGAGARAAHLDTLVLLSDGVPSRGAVLMPEELLAQTLAANRSLQVVIHCVNAAQGSNLLLDQLTAGSGGMRAKLTDK